MMTAEGAFFNANGYQTFNRQKNEKRDENR